MVELETAEYLQSEGSQKEGLMIEHILNLFSSCAGSTENPISSPTYNLPIFQVVQGVLRCCGTNARVCGAY